MQDNTEQFDQILNQFSTGKELNDFLNPKNSLPTDKKRV